MTENVRNGREPALFVQREGLSEGNAAATMGAVPGCQTLMRQHRVSPVELLAFVLIPHSSSEDHLAASHAGVRLGCFGPPGGREVGRRLEEARHEHENHQR